jgi:hypothetical protein
LVLAVVAPLGAIAIHWRWGTGAAVLWCLFMVVCAFLWAEHLGAMDQRELSEGPPAEPWRPYAEVDPEAIFQEARAEHLAKLEAERLRQQQGGKLDPDVVAALAMLRGPEGPAVAAALGIPYSAPPQSVPELHTPHQAHPK